MMHPGKGPCNGRPCVFWRRVAAISASHRRAADLTNVSSTAENTRPFYLARYTVLSMIEPGLRSRTQAAASSIAVSPKNPNHVYIFKIWENAAAVDAHRATDHLKAYLSATKDMVAKRDIVPMQFDAFMALAKVNGAATPKDPGAHEFNIAVSQADPHHVMLYEVYDNAAALDAHRATEHLKTYAAGTKDMVANRKVDQLSSVSMNRP